MLEYADLLSGMTQHQQTLFMAEYQGSRKEPTTALLLNLFLGGIGVHHFYLGNTAAGVLYLLLSWTLIPLMISIFELFGIMGRTRMHNRRLAQSIAANIYALSGETPPASVGASTTTVPDRIATRSRPVLAGGLILIGVLMAVILVLSALSR